MADFCGRLLWPTFVGSGRLLWPTSVADFFGRLLSVLADFYGRLFWPTGRRLSRPAILPFGRPTLADKNRPRPPALEITISTPGGAKRIPFRPEREKGKI